MAVLHRFKYCTFLIVEEVLQNRQYITEKTVEKSLTLIIKIKRLTHDHRGHQYPLSGQQNKLLKQALCPNKSLHFTDSSIYVSNNVPNIYTYQLKLDFQTLKSVRNLLELRDSSRALLISSNHKHRIHPWN